MLNRLRTMEYAVKNSGWLMLDSVDTLFKNAKDRVYDAKSGGKLVVVIARKKRFTWSSL